jgi:acyl-CoA thioester hydrolase
MRQAIIMQAVNVKVLDMPKKQSPQEPAKKLLHTIQLQVRWGDMDIFGHVNNANYFRYLEQARISWFETIGAPSGNVGHGPILVAAACNFRIPIVYPATVEVRTYGKAPGRTSIPMYQEIVDANAPSTLFADGDSTIVWIDYQLQKSTPLPDEVRALIGLN